MPKRPHEDVNVDELINSINLEKGLRDTFLELNPNELATLLAEFADTANLPIAAIKKARIGLPSFSTVKWAKFAPQYGLPTSLSDDNLNLEHFITPRYWLPPSLHKTMFANAWHCNDVYRERYDNGEQARVRLLEPYIVPIVGLFRGRVIDKPEQAMAETQYSTGGDVEHKILMIGGILFCVIEFKLGHLTENNFAQLFLELLSAAEQNSQLEFAGLRIYGLLIDLTQFKFYSYNPTTKQFYRDQQILVGTHRVTALYDMINVSNKIFGIILTAYIDGLRATISRRANQNDASSILYWPLKFTSEETESHGSIDRWEAALEFAERCVDKFKESAVSIQDMEARANDALELLAKSVCSIPLPSRCAGPKDPLTPAKLKALAMDVKQNMTSLVGLHVHVQFK